MDYTIIGKIINTHGVRGELKIHPMTGDIDRFSDLKKVYIGEDKENLTVEKVRYHKSFVIIKFGEYDNINQVIPFKQKYIYVDDGDKVVLPKDSYFIDDLIDCKVFDLDNKEIGHIKDIIYTTKDDVYIVKSSFDNKEYLIPAIKNFVKDVDIKNKIVIIDPIEGMIE
jgi:16S rRNA processing protein RimM